MGGGWSGGGVEWGRGGVGEGWSGGGVEWGGVGGTITLIVSITKCLTVIGSQHAYLKRNWR